MGDIGGLALASVAMLARNMAQYRGRLVREAKKIQKSWVDHSWSWLIMGKSAPRMTEEY